MEHYILCEACGKGFTYTDDDIKKKERQDLANAAAAIGALGGAISGNYAGTIANQGFMRNVKDYSRCPHCGSSVIKEVSFTDFQQALIGNNAAPQINANASKESLIKRTELLIESGDWNQAKAYCNQLLDLSPEDANIYLLMVLIDNKVKSFDELIEKRINITDSKYFSIINRYKDKEIDSLLNSITEKYKIAVSEDKCNRLYCEAIKYKEQHTVESTVNAISILKEIKDYKNSGELLKQCQETLDSFERANKEEQRKALVRKENGKKRIKKIGILLIIFFSIVAIACIASSFAKQRKTAGIYDKAISYEQSGQYDDAINLFSSLGDYEDSKDHIISCQYGSAIQSKEAGDYESAYNLFYQLGTYKDSVDQLESIKPLYYNEMLYKANAGDAIYFGNYEQDGDTSNGKEYIEWIVLDRKEDCILALSKYALNSKAFSKDNENYTWDKSDIRGWLNGEFADDAFSTEQKKMILEKNVKADRNPEYDTDPGKDTNDKVFLLSIDEASNYDVNLICEPSQYTLSQGCDFADFYDKGNNSCSWWLRTPGVGEGHVAFVNAEGKVWGFGHGSEMDFITTRPAIWISTNH